MSVLRPCCALSLERAQEQEVTAADDGGWAGASAGGAAGGSAGSSAGGGVDGASTAEVSHGAFYHTAYRAAPRLVCTIIEAACTWQVVAPHEGPVDVEEEEAQLRVAITASLADGGDSAGGSAGGSARNKGGCMGS